MSCFALTRFFLQYITRSTNDNAAIWYGTSYWIPTKIPPNCKVLILIFIRFQPISAGKGCGLFRTPKRYLVWKCTNTIGGWRLFSYSRITERVDNLRLDSVRLAAEQKLQSGELFIFPSNRTRAKCDNSEGENVGGTDRGHVGNGHRGPRLVAGCSEENHGNASAEYPGRWRRYDAM